MSLKGGLNHGPLGQLIHCKTSCSHCVISAREVHCEFWLSVYLFMHFMRQPWKVVQPQHCQPQCSHPKLHCPLPLLLPLVPPGHSVHSVPPVHLVSLFQPVSPQLPSLDREMPSTKINPWHTTGTFMCPCSTTVLCDGHIYVPSDLIQHNRFVKRKGFPQTTSSAIRTPF